MTVYSTSTTYGGLMAAGMSESGILYTITSEYQGITYKTGLNVFDCKSGIRTLHRNLDFSPVPALNGVFMTVKDAAVYLSITRSLHHSAAPFLHHSITPPLHSSHG